MRFSLLLPTLFAVGLITGCQTTTTSNVADPFAKTRQPVPEVPQFKDGKPVSPSETEKTDTVAAATAPAPQPTRKVVETTVRGSEVFTSLRSTNVVDVVVDTTDADKGFGWAFTLDKARAAQIADRVITSHLEKTDNDKGAPIVVTVKFNMLYLASGGGVLIGSPNSASRVSVGIRDNRSNSVMVSGARVNAAGSRRIGGLLAAGQVRGQEEEMALVAQGIANELEKALFKQ